LATITFSIRYIGLRTEIVSSQYLSIHSDANVNKFRVLLQE